MAGTTPLNTDAKKRYIAHPFHCPWCNSLLLKADPEVSVGGSGGAEVWQSVRCDACGKRWRDRLEVVDFEEIVPALIPGDADEEMKVKALAKLYELRDYLVCTCKQSQKVGTHCRCPIERRTTYAEIVALIGAADVLPEGSDSPSG